MKIFRIAKKEVSTIPMSEAYNETMDVPDYRSTTEDDYASEMRKALDEVLPHLSEREQIVLKSRFGYDDGYSRTLKEIGEMFNVVPESIRRIENKALRKLRNPRLLNKLMGLLPEENRALVAQAIYSTIRTAKKRVSEPYMDLVESFITQGVNDYKDLVKAGVIVNGQVVEGWPWEGSFHGTLGYETREEVADLIAWLTEGGIDEDAMLLANSPELVKLNIDKKLKELGLSRRTPGTTQAGTSGIRTKRPGSKRSEPKTSLYDLLQKRMKDTRLALPPASEESTDTKESIPLEGNPEGDQPRAAKSIQNVKISQKVKKCKCGGRMVFEKGDGQSKEGFECEECGNFESTDWREDTEKQAKSLWEMKKLSGTIGTSKCKGCGQVGNKNSRCRCGKWIPGKPIPSYEGSWAQQEEQKRQEKKASFQNQGDDLNVGAFYEIIAEGQNLRGWLQSIDPNDQNNLTFKDFGGKLFQVKKNKTDSIKQATAGNSVGAKSLWDLKKTSARIAEPLRICRGCGKWVQSEWDFKNQGLMCSECRKKVSNAPWEDYLAKQKADQQ